MTQYLVSDALPLTQAVEAVAFFVPENGSLAKIEPSLQKDYFPHLEKLLKDKKFTGGKGQTFVLPCSVGKKIVHILFVGIGNPSSRKASEDKGKEAKALMTDKENHYLSKRVF